MRKSILGLVLGTAVATAGFGAGPAAADHNDTGKILFGALALLAIGAIIDEQTSSKPTTKPKEVTVDRDWVHPKKRVPLRCMRHVRTFDGKVRMFGRKCLKNNFRYFGSLPKACKVRVESRRGNIRKGYRPNCLRKRGYKFI